MADYIWYPVTGDGESADTPLVWGTVEADWNTSTNWVQADTLVFENPAEYSGAIPGSGTGGSGGPGNDNVAVLAGDVFLIHYDPKFYTANGSNAAPFLQGDTYGVRVLIDTGTVDIGTLTLAGFNEDSDFDTSQRPKIDVEGATFQIQNGLLSAGTADVVYPLMVDPNPVWGTAGGTLDTIGGGTIAIGDGGTVEVSGSVQTAIILTFNDGLHDLLALGGVSATRLHGFRGTISNFVLGDTIEIDGITVTGSKYAGGTLTLMDQGGSIALTMTGSFATSDFIVTNGSNGAFITLGGGAAQFDLASAGAISPNPVNFGPAHVGNTLAQTLTVTNTALLAGLPEALDGGIGSATGAAITNAGSFTGLVASATNHASLVVGLSTANEGVQSGTALVSLRSDGTGIDGNGITGLPSQTIDVSATVYGYAQPELPATVNVGAARVGGAAPEQFLMVGDGTTADAFKESLVYGVGPSPSGFSVASGATGTIAAGSATAAAIALSTAVSGDFTGSTITVGLTSTGAGTSGLPDTVLTAQPVTLNGKVYAPAIARLSTASLNFGVVHVGDSISATVAISNTASGALTDVLTGGFGTVTGAFSGAGNLGGGVAAGTSGTLTIDMATTAPGVAIGSAALSLSSHDSDLPDISTASGPIDLTGTVDNYAVASWEDLSGGDFQQNGNVDTLDFGDVALGAVDPVADLAALNAATGLADLMSGTFETSGGGFINTGLSGFSGLGAGQADTAPTVSLSTAQIGTFTESITLSASGTNSSGFLGTLTPQVLTVTGTIVGPRTLVWTGASDSAFANNLNWDDLANGPSPTQVAPGAADTAEFNSAAAAISGSATVAALEVGSAGTGSLNLTNGASITTGSLDAGIAADSVGEIALIGTGTGVIVTDLATVADDGTGVLSILSGASVTINTLVVGSEDGSSGDVDVSGAGTDFLVTGNATVADDGTGVMSVLNGATFDAANLTIGSQGDSSGALVVSGEGSVVNISGDLNVGTALGTGDLTIGPGATVNAKVINLQGEVVLENGTLDPTVNLINQGLTAGGSGAFAAGDIVDEGVLQAGASKASQKLLVVTGTIVGGGPWTINGTAQAEANGDVGVLQINAGGTMEINGVVSNAALTTFTDDVTPQSTYSVSDSVIDVNFEDAAGMLKLDNIAGFAGTITTFHSGDRFVITGGTLSTLGVSNNNTLTVSDSGHGGTDQIIFGSAVSASGFNILSGNTIQVACFAAGTRIETEAGPVAVDDLAVGDQVITDDGMHEPIVWIGQRAVNCERHPKPESVWPVRVVAGAFGDNIPARDLYLSPDHAVFVNDVLIPVKLLINGTSIKQVKREHVTYFHVELPRHSVILAEGLTVESYLDTGDRANFQSTHGPIRLVPDFTARAWEMAGCAPLVMTGPILEHVKRRLTTSPASDSSGARLRIANSR